MTRGRYHNTAIVLDPTGNADAQEAFAAAIALPGNSLTALATSDRLYRAHAQARPSEPTPAPERRQGPPVRRERQLPPPTVPGRGHVYSADPAEQMAQRLAELQARPQRRSIRR